ncbi:hypothetical protein CONLIGDRAFT_640982 [Coniochaeta ligniaria NRRL 30616]|uniref:Dynamin N-terminal domain-containing protein n=1 Tax=Coniochaeta ligniaria NRRL 30616 TaxID=1408157 RepID=A0A1J7JWX9_9PEZI|nr:hypothetical protein CONLIGDRAFT_640982 [Coniochaeta ligniaria NRRL 30616]
MSSPTEEAVGPSQPARSQDISLPAVAPPKKEEGNVELHTIPAMSSIPEEMNVAHTANEDAHEMDNTTNNNNNGRKEEGNVELYIDQHMEEETNDHVAHTVNEDAHNMDDTTNNHNSCMKEEGNVELHTIPPTSTIGEEMNDHVADTANEDAHDTDDTTNNANNDRTEEHTNNGSSDAQTETFTNLERIRSSSVSETIGDGVELGLVTLDRLQAVLNIEARDGNEAARWLTRFASLKRKLKETRTVVGILGNTGAGKSSLINALLDEESLIPTNCMRACTAVPTEILFNHDENARHCYRGEAEFITEEDWQKEVSLLLAELVDPAKKLSKDYLQPDTGAGIAYAKIKAVYPKLSNERLAKSNVKDLMDDPAVKDVLGTIKLHQRAKAADLKADLQIYVDSAEKYGADNQAGTTMAYWPLIKVVRIYLKAKVLSTGTVLVDLPGVQDSNAARSAVADRFREECSSIWIVSPINRAVDDKAAKHLLGTSFKLQLTMDGSYSNVTFVCSKTDEISVKEVADKLDVDGAIRSIWAKEEECGRDVSKLKGEIQGLMEEREELDEMRDELETQRSKKRKLADLHKSADAQDPLDVGDGDLEEETAHVTKESVRIRKRLKDLKTQMSALQSECKRLSVEATARCVEARNNYSKDAIRSDFAEGVRDTVEDAETQHPVEPQPATEPDYAQIAKSLPVFCVSSRGYQFLMGRSLKDGTVGGYRCAADTQIPQLQEHAMQLGDLELITTRKAFLADLARLMRSLLLWASSGRSGGGSCIDRLSEDEISKMSRLDDLITTLRVVLDNRIKPAMTGIRTRVKHDLLEPISPMCVDAAVKLPGVALGWSKNGNAIGGPMRWATYRSIVMHRGEGVTRISQGMNFNDDLFVPLKKRMALHWASAFGSAFNDGMTVYASGAIEALENFHKTVLDCPELDCSNSAHLGLLNDQLNARVQSIRQVEAKFKVVVKHKQRGGSRWFVTAIAGYMKDIYEHCSCMHGAGCFNRLKEALEDFVDENRQEILSKSLQAVGNLLDKICSSFEERMRKHAEDVLLKIKEDYQLAILGREMVLSGADASPSLLLVQEKVYAMLLRVDGEFASVLRTASVARETSK